MLETECFRELNIFQYNGLIVPDLRPDGGVASAHMAAQQQSGMGGFFSRLFRRKVMMPQPNFHFNSFTGPLQFRLQCQHHPWHHHGTTAIHFGIRRLSPVRKGRMQMPKGRRPMQIGARSAHLQLLCRCRNCAAWTASAKQQFFGGRKGEWREGQQRGEQSSGNCHRTHQNSTAKW